MMLTALHTWIRKCSGVPDTPGFRNCQLKVVGLFLSLKSILNQVLLGYITCGRVLTPAMLTLNVLEPFWYWLGERHLLQGLSCGVP